MIEILNRDLHRITTTTLVYKPDFTYLITRRAMHKKAHPGKWTIPGGGLTVDDYIDTPQSEHGENLWYNVLEKSLKREVKEETGLEIGKPELLVDIDLDPEKDTIDFKWVTLEEAKNYDLIPGIWEEIRQANEILRGRQKRAQ